MQMPKVPLSDKLPPSPRPSDARPTVSAAATAAAPFGEIVSQISFKDVTSLKAGSAELLRLLHREHR